MTVRQHSQVTGDCQTTQSSYGGLSDKSIRRKTRIRDFKDMIGALLKENYMNITTCTW